METLVGDQTTYRRPVVNSRDEALCGRSATPVAIANQMARLHVIFFDNTLCHVASLLKVGMMQIILAMIEAQRVDISCFSTIHWRPRCLEPRPEVGRAQPNAVGQPS